LAAGAGGIECDASPLVTLSNPFGLDSWTMPLIEVTLIGLMVACFVHALRWRRAHGDSSNLVIWGAGVMALLFIEPIAYLPQWFGVEEELGLTFVHNQFTVQFFYNRLPLYIVGMYPVFAYLSYVLVQRTGVFERQRAWVGAVCIASTFHCLYEVVEFVGPQFRWWIWNYDIPTGTGQPTIGATPYINIQAFCIGIPLGMALATRWLATKPNQGSWRIAGNVVLVSLATWLLVLACAAVTLWAFVDAYRARIRGNVELPEGIDRDRFALLAIGAYLVVAAVTWAAAFPDFLAATGGLTPNGSHVGSLPYATLSLVTSIALVVGAYAASSSSTTRPNERVEVSA
jgi:hypothetical protein